MAKDASFELARRLRARGGVPIGEVFAFLSALYFRGKLAYSLQFARPPAGVPGALVITPNQGLWPVDQKVTLAGLRGLAKGDVHERNLAYVKPLMRDALAIAERAPACEVVLLGSVATSKYVAVLRAVFGPRLLFPATFLGRGDMSRGGLMLRCVRENRELDYIRVPE